MKKHCEQIRAKLNARTMVQAVRNEWLEKAGTK